MQEYVDAASESGQLRSYANILAIKTLSAITRDQRYKTLIQGLQATIVTLQRCYAFAILLQQIEGPFKPRIGQVLNILGGEKVTGLLNTNIYAPISVKTIAEYDHLLKSRLNDQIKDVLFFIAELDVSIAVGNVAAARNFTYAKARPKKRQYVICF